MNNFLLLEPRYLEIQYFDDKIFSNIHFLAVFFSFIRRPCLFLSWIFINYKYILQELFFSFDRFISFTKNYSSLVLDQLFSTYLIFFLSRNPIIYLIHEHEQMVHSLLPSNHNPYSILFQLDIYRLFVLSFATSIFFSLFRARHLLRSQEYDIRLYSKECSYAGCSYRWLLYRLYDGKAKDYSFLIKLILKLINIHSFLQNQSNMF